MCVVVAEVVLADVCVMFVSSWSDINATDGLPACVSARASRAIGGNRGGRGGPFRCVCSVIHMTVSYDVSCGGRDLHAAAASRHRSITCFRPSVVALPPP